MKKLFKQFQLYSLLMFFWLILSGSYDIKTILYGSLFSVFIIIFTYKIIFELDDDILRLPQMWRFIWFGGIVFVSIMKAANQHMVRIIKGQNAYQVFEVNLDTNNLVIITLIANAITLTPGTITLSVEGRTLKVIGFCEKPDDIQMMIEEIYTYQKPFLYRRI